MGKGLVTKIIGVIVCLGGVVMNIYDASGWGWALFVGFIIIIAGISQEDDNGNVKKMFDDL